MPPTGIVEERWNIGGGDLSERLGSRAEDESVYEREGTPRVGISMLAGEDEEWLRPGGRLLGSSPQPTISGSRRALDD